MLNKSCGNSFGLSPIRLSNWARTFGPTGSEMHRCAEQALQVPLHDGEIVLRGPQPVEGRVLHDAYHVTRPDPDRFSRHPFEHLRMIGEKNVAGRDFIAGQPADSEFVDQSRRARLERTDQMLAPADEREQRAVQSEAFGGLQLRSEGGRGPAAISRVGGVDYVEMHRLELCRSHAHTGRRPWRNRRKRRDDLYLNRTWRHPAFCHWPSERCAPPPASW